MDDAFGGAEKEKVAGREREDLLQHRRPRIHDDRWVSEGVEKEEVGCDWEMGAGC